MNGLDIGEPRSFVERLPRRIFSVAEEGAGRDGRVDLGAASFVAAECRSFLTLSVSVIGKSVD